MKAKTINKIITNKFNSFLKSIDDEDLRVRIEGNSIITGGCIVSMLLNEDVNDYDLYFRDMETTRRVARYMVEKFKSNNEQMKFKNTRVPSLDVAVEAEIVKIVSKSAGVASESQEDAEYQYFEALDPGDPSSQEFVDNVFSAVKDSNPGKKEKYRPIFLTSNAITCANDIQIIIRFYGDPDEVHKNFDFEHCKAYWTSWDQQLVLPQSVLECIITKELRYTGSLYPLCSIFRIRKFIQRGWRISAGQILKMAFQLNELDLKDFAVLEDQLIGVDIAYFHELLTILKKEFGANLKDVDQSYVVKLIDELF